MKKIRKGEIKIRIKKIRNQRNYLKMKFMINNGFNHVEMIIMTIIDMILIIEEEIEMMMMMMMMTKMMKILRNI